MSQESVVQYAVSVRVRILKVTTLFFVCQSSLLNFDIYKNPLGFVHIAWANRYVYTSKELRTANKYRRTEHAQFLVFHVQL